MTIPKQLFRIENKKVSLISHYISFESQLDATRDPLLPTHISLPLTTRIMQCVREITFVEEYVGLIVFWAVIRGTESGERARERNQMKWGAVFNRQQTFVC